MGCWCLGRAVFSCVCCESQNPELPCGGLGSEPRVPWQASTAAVSLSLASGVGRTDVPQDRWCAGWPQRVCPPPELRANEFPAL